MGAMQTRVCRRESIAVYTALYSQDSKRRAMMVDFLLYVLTVVWGN